MKNFPVWLKILFGLVASFAVLFLLMQLVPYGHDHVNPPVLSEPQWNNAETRALAQRACFDCHSNETVWPAYTSIAPGSWLIQRDVDEGREKMNFSEWGQDGSMDYDEIEEVVMEGEMPPFQYLIIHGEARLTQAEKAQLLDGFRQSLGVEK